MAPVDGGYSMGVDSIAAVVNRFQARLVLPRHWISADPLAAFPKRMHPGFAVEIGFGPDVEISRATLPRRLTFPALDPAPIP